jgi:hypothetical protein
MSKLTAIIIMCTLAGLFFIMFTIYLCLVMAAESDRQAGGIYRGGYQPKGGKGKPLTPPRGHSGKSDCGIDGVVR